MHPKSIKTALNTIVFVSTGARGFLAVKGFSCRIVG